MATTTTIKTEPKLPPVFAGRGQTNLAEHSTQRWYHVADVPYARLLEADYWGKFFAREMNLHDEIDAYDAAGTYGARLLVVGVDAGRNQVTVVERHAKLDLQPIAFEPFVSGEMIAAYEGPIKKWTVRRQADKIVLADRIPDREEARYQMTAVIPQRMTA